MVFVPSSHPVMSRFRRGVRRGKVSVTNVCDANQTRQLAPAIAGRWLGKKWPIRHGSRRFAPRGGERSLSLAVAIGFQLSEFQDSAFSPRRHRADTCARSSRQVSARFRRTAGRTHQFASAPLHFTAISQTTFPFHSFRRPQTAETVKDSGAPEDSRGRDAPHIGQDR